MFFMTREICFRPQKVAYRCSVYDGILVLFGSAEVEHQPLVVSKQLGRIWGMNEHVVSLKRTNINRLNAMKEFVVKSYIEGAQQSSFALCACAPGYCFPCNWFRNTYDQFSLQT